MTRCKLEIFMIKIVCKYTDFKVKRHATPENKSNFFILDKTVQGVVIASRKDEAKPRERLWK